MTRNLKALGLALLAVFAMSAFAASSASAVDVLTVEGGSKHVTGTDHVNNVFEIVGPNVAVECETSIFTGTVENGASKAEVEAEYEDTVGEPESGHCGSDIGEAEVDMNGCEYVLTGETTGDHEGVEGKDATVWIECPDEAEITVTTELANLHIHEQTPTEGGVTYTNTPGKVLGIDVTVTGITYSCSPHFFCTLGGVATEGNNAIYTGTVNVPGVEWSTG